MLPDHPEIEQLVGCKQPLLIGVRHHSAAIARVIPAILDRFKPTAVLIELPPEFSEWLDWLGSEELEAPVALAGTTAGLSGLVFYPFADFSPELAAIRWAKSRNVPLHAIDRPVAERNDKQIPRDAGQPSGLLEAIMHNTQTDDVGSLWERLVETPAANSDPESIRRAALLFGWALRMNDGEASVSDRAREACMREAIASVGGKAAAVIGSYHAAALLPEPLLWSPLDEDTQPDSEAPPPLEVTTAMIPYSFNQLDERSGYPAGIRDPWWHQRVFESADVSQLDNVVADMTVGVCRQLRTNGHAAGAADGKEVLRMARDLARLRGFAAAGRREFIESVQTCLTQGQLHGRGKAVASAMQNVLIGARNGTLPDNIPRSGLAPNVEQLLKTLNLPGPEALGKDEKRIRLDPLRSRLDRARVVTLQRLLACEVPYGTPASNSSDENLTQVWDLKWEHATSAMLELSAAKGATLEQATFGILNFSSGENPDVSAVDIIVQIEQAAKTGVHVLVQRGLHAVMNTFGSDAGLAELTRAMRIIERIQRGHVPGLPFAEKNAWPGLVQHFTMPANVETTPLLQAAIARVEGLFGSEEISDVYALLDLILWFQQQDEDAATLESGRLLWLIREMFVTGSPLMQGAANAALLLLGERDQNQFGDTAGSWIDAAVDAGSRRDLTERFIGTLVTVLPRLAADVSNFDRVEERVAALPDEEFLKRLPAIRGAFEVITPSTREVILNGFTDRLPESETDRRKTIADPALATERYNADEAGRMAVLELMPDLQLTHDLEAADAKTVERNLINAGHQISMGDRWRLMIGMQNDQMNQSSCRVATALDELYGNSRSRRGSGNSGGASGQSGGRELPFPSTREWSEELTALFGGEVREEVLGKAAENGRAGAIAALDSETVSPSIDLLEQVLSMKGSLADSHTEHLRRLTKRIVDQLVQQLAVRLRPALTGLSVAQPTRRRTPKLDLKRTIQANLHTVHKTEDGTLQIVPDRLYFRTLAKRSLDWHLIFVVDVSGSMEPSVIYSAMMSAIFNALPAVSVRFLAFSTKVIDFSDHVDDPLSLLLEVEIGGGTHIAKGLNAARQQLEVPSRTIVVLLSDFEEGYPVNQLLAEVSALSDTGAKLLGLASLDDAGTPRYHKGIAEQVAAHGMPVAALSPLELARWVGEQIS